jgi:hypothetical protein
MLKIRGGAKMGKYGMKADVDFAVRAYPTAKKLEDLSTYNMVTPFRFEIHDLYLYGRDVFGAKGLDLRIGQQKAMFGAGDQFNPTNTINANDANNAHFADRDSAAAGISGRTVFGRGCHPGFFESD